MRDRLLAAEPPDAFFLARFLEENRQNDTPKE